MEEKTRKVGSKFSSDDADEIFNKLDKIDSNESKKSNKNLESQMKDVSELLNEAKSSPDDKAVELFKKVLVIMPDNVDAYVGIAAIYKKQGNVGGEIDILKKAVLNVEGSSKSDLMKRLKEIS